MNRPESQLDWRKALAEELWHRPLVLLAALYMLGLAALAGGRFLLLLPLALGLGVVIAKCRPRDWLAPLALLLACGLAWNLLRVERRQPVADFTDRAVVLQGAVAREPSITSRGSALLIEAQQIICAGKQVPVTGAVWVYLPARTRAEFQEVVEVIGKLRSSRAGRRAGLPWIGLGDPRLLRRLGKRPEGLVEAAGRRMRSQVVAVLAPVMPGGYRELHANLLASLFFGTHGAELPRAIVDLFQRTGTMHILVVSGTQISLLFMLVYFPSFGAHWRRRRMLQAQLQALGGDTDIQPTTAWLPGLPRLLPAPAVIAFAIVLMSLYALLTQGGKSVARAAVMSGLIGLSLLLRQLSAVADYHSLDTDRYTLLAAAALGILAFEPAALFQPGFQLSFAAVWGLAFLAPKLRALLPFISDFWAYLLVGPIAAQLATFPVAAWHFGAIPIIGFLSNLVAVPIAALLLWLGLAGFALGSLWRLAAWPLGWLCGQLCWLMVRSLTLFAQVPHGIISVGRFSWPVAVAYYLLLLVGGGLLGLTLSRRKTPSPYPEVLP